MTTKGQDKIESIVTKGRADARELETHVRSALKYFVTDLLNYMETIARTPENEVKDKYRILRSTVLTKYNNLDNDLHNKISQYFIYQVLVPSFVVADTGSDKVTEIFRGFVKTLEGTGNNNGQESG